MKEGTDWSKLAKEAISGLQSGKGLTGTNGAMAPLLKKILEASMEAEMDAHLDEDRPKNKNRRNGHGSKRVKSSLGEVDVSTPRDRNGTFTPVVLPKRQTQLPDDLESKILGLYGLGMSYRDIRAHFLEMYSVVLSEATITRITDKVIPEIRSWQERPLESIYPIIWMDAIHFKVRDEGRVITRAVYSVLGLNMEGKRDILGLYLGYNESSKFWLQVLDDLRFRGVEDVFIACVDNLSGFKEAIESVFPQTEVQLCVIHQIRNSLKYLAHKDKKEFMVDLKAVYKASEELFAEQALLALEEKWNKKYPAIIRSWRKNWDYLSNYFKYPQAIRKVIYTTNSVEGYHRMVRKYTKSKGAFTSDLAVLKLVYLATINIQNTWVGRVNAWPTLINELSIFFDDRIKP